MQSDEEEEELKYPDECRVLDIMNQKYYDAVAFFNDTQDKTQLPLAIKEFQRFSHFYNEKMLKYLEFDPSDIEEDIYLRLPEEMKSRLNDPKIIKEIQVIKVRKA